MLRWLVSLPVAALCSLALFSLMALMVKHGTMRPPTESVPIAFDIFMQDQDTAVQRRQRAVPEKPEPPKVPPTPVPVTTVQKQSVSQPDMPEIKLNTGINGVLVQAPTIGDLNVMETASNQQAMPLFRVEPNYPAKALRRGMEGYVIISFTIDPTGRPTDMNVVDANPRRMFEREAMRALRKWKYQPKVIDGEPVPQPGQTVKLEFKLRR